MYLCVCIYVCIHGLPWCLRGKESACQCRRCGFDPWVGKIPWCRKWQPALVFLPGESHGQGSLADFSRWGHKEMTMMEHLSQTCTHMYILIRSLFFSQNQSFKSTLSRKWASLVALLVKNLPAMRETCGLGRSLGEGKAPHSSILAWRIQWTVSSPWGRKESRHDWAAFS